MPFKRRFRDKYASGQRERIYCPNSVQLVHCVLGATTHLWAVCISIRTSVHQSDIITNDTKRDDELVASDAPRGTFYLHYYHRRCYQHLYVTHEICEFV